MTDLTAAQLVQRLKDTTAESWRWELKAATLIEQQAEQIAGLEQTARVNYGLYKSATEDLDEAESEVVALRKLIEDAQHDSECASGFYTNTDGSAPNCDCWKSKALAEEETL